MLGRTLCILLGHRYTGSHPRVCRRCGITLWDIPWRQVATTVRISGPIAQRGL